MHVKRQKVLTDVYKDFKINILEINEDICLNYHKFISNQITVSVIW